MMLLLTVTKYLYFITDHQCCSFCFENKLSRQILFVSDVHAPLPTHNAPHCLRRRSSWRPQAASSTGRCLAPDPGLGRSEPRHRCIPLVVAVVLFDGCGSVPCYFSLLFCLMQTHSVETRLIWHRLTVLTFHHQTPF